MGQAAGSYGGSDPVPVRRRFRPSDIIHRGRGPSDSYDRFQMRGDGSRFQGLGAAAPVQVGAGGEWGYPLRGGGEAAFDPILNTVSSATATQRLWVTVFDAEVTETITQVDTWTANVAAAATPSLCRVGVYVVDAAETATLAASVANDTALWNGTGARFRSALSAPFAKIRGQRIAMGLLCVTATTVPQWSSRAFSAPGVIIQAATAYRIRAGHLDSQADLPASFSLGSLSASAGATQMFSALIP